MKYSLIISAVSSNSGKTILTTALLSCFKGNIRPFKIGPDFIDIQFHKKICQTNSINLDNFLLDNPKQLCWIFDRYSDKEISLIEGVMGYYDGTNNQTSTYDISKILQIPTLLILDGSGSYTTISAVLKGLKTYKQDNTIKAVVINHIGSKSHFKLIKKQILDDFSDIVVLGWIEKNLQSLSSIHLGLNLKDKKKIKQISKDVLKHIDITKLLLISKVKKTKKPIKYPFDKIDKIDKKIALVWDRNFSFLYYDNLVFLKEVFKKVVIIKAIKNQKIPKSADIVIINGGYIEIKKNYDNIKNSNIFRNSLIRHSKSKPIYAECAGLLYLGNCIDDKKMSGILDIDFILTNKRVRLGYYHDNFGLKGHAFHYVKQLSNPFGIQKLSKDLKFSDKSYSGFKTNKTYGTFLHIFFRNNFTYLKKILLI